ncbi:MAG: lipopolysaccharide biosynthesis protein [Alphaproteobacteria bacterium]|nr:lipopolysaccharide biosynthesis protein [Alphaproteobacteria bacterium]
MTAVSRINRLRELFDAGRSDAILRRVARNASYLLSANFVAAVLGIITLSVTARSLGPLAFGLFVLIEIYGRSVDRLVRLESWHAVVRYGADSLEQDQSDEFRQLIKGSTLFDVLGATLSAAFGIALATTIAPLLQLDAWSTFLAQCYCASLALSLTSTPIAVLRLFDKFGILARLTMVSATTRLLMATAAWVAGGDLLYFVIVLIVQQVIDCVLMLYFGWRELHRQGYDHIWRVPMRGFFGTFAGVAGFVWHSNLNVMLRTLTQRFDTMIVAAILGPAAAGLYQLSQRIARLLVRFSGPIAQSIYPDIAKLWVRGEIAEFRRIVILLNVAIGALVTVGVLIASSQMTFLVSFAFGAQFLPAVPIILARLVAVALFLSGAVLNPALLSMNLHRQLSRVTIIGTTIFFVAIVPLVFAFGAFGAALAHVVSTAIWLIAGYAIFLAGTSPGVLEAKPADA